MRLLLVLLLLVPLAAAQGHDHGAAGIAIASDLGPERIAHVGTPVQFNLIAFGDDHVPDFHQDLPVRVLLQDRALWETTAVTGHDYDGINAFAVAFPAPGPFSVQALMDGEVVATYNGTAIEAENLEVELNVAGPRYDASTGTVRYNLTSGGQPLDLLDAWLELWWEDQLVLRAHTHADGEQEVWLRYPSPGNYLLRVVGYQAYPAASGQVFLPAVHEQRFQISTSPDVGVPTPPLEAPMDPNAVVHGQGGSEYQLIGTYDPFTRVGPGTLQHLGAIVVDPDGHPVQHVDFEATLTGPRGDVFRSTTLHEHDGIYELATRQHDVGTYILHVTATHGDWTSSMEMPYHVLPPVQATLAGPQTVALDAEPAPAGKPGNAMLSIRDLAGRPFAHGEIHTQILGADGVPLVQAKLHTHGLGDYPFKVALPEAGQHALRLSPFPLDAQPVTQYDLSAAQALTAAAGPGFAAAQPAAPPEDAQTPGFLPAGTLALLAVLVRRR